MHVPLDAMRLPSDHDANFAMSLQPLDPVNNVNACSLHLTGPVNIALLIKSRFQLNQGGDIFTILRRADEGVDDRAFFTCPIKCLFDGKDVGVIGRLFNESNHRLKALVWVIQQHTFFGKRLKNAGCWIQ